MRVLDGALEVIATNICKRLMSSLEKFAKFAQPDKLLMVGEVRIFK